MIGLHEIPKETTGTFVISKILFDSLRIFRGHFQHLKLSLVRQMGELFLFYENDQDATVLWTDVNTNNWQRHRNEGRLINLPECQMCERSTFSIEDIERDSNIKIIVEA